MEQMNTGVTPELESKILNLNIENYLKTFDKKQGLTWQIIGYDNKVAR